MTSNQAYETSGVGIRNTADYSPFGVQLDGRTQSGTQYRYGYQGSEKDDEVKGKGNSYTTHFRQLNTRTGRWNTRDPKEASIPYQTPYCSMDNNPIQKNDPLGDTIKITNSYISTETGERKTFTVIYDDGKLYRKGKEYTPQSGGYIEQVQNELIKLEKSHHRMKSVINRLENSKETHEITNYHEKTRGFFMCWTSLRIRNSASHKIAKRHT